MCCQRGGALGVAPMGRCATREESIRSAVAVVAGELQSPQLVFITDATDDHPPSIISALLPSSLP